MNKKAFEIFDGMSKDMLVHAAIGAVSGVVTCEWLTATARVERIKGILEAYEQKKAEMQEKA